VSNIVGVNDTSSIDAEVERIVALPYRRELLRNEDGSWFARVVELRGCMTEGATSVKAIENLDDAMREWIRTQLEDSDPIPQPGAEAKYSGKFVVRVPPSLHRDVAERAERESVSLNAFVINAIARAIGPTPRVERLAIEKTRLMSGTIRIGESVITEEQSVYEPVLQDELTVPLTRDEVNVSRTRRTEGDR